MNPICPWCEKEIGKITSTDIDIEKPGHKKLRKGIAYSCPNDGCGKLLNVEINPVPLFATLTTAIDKHFKKLYR